MPRVSTRNQLLVQRAQRGQQDVVGQLGVEAELVDLVVAGDPPPQERQRLGDLARPSRRASRSSVAAPGSGSSAGDGPGEPARRVRTARRRRRAREPAWSRRPAVRGFAAARRRRSGSPAPRRGSAHRCSPPPPPSARRQRTLDRFDPLGREQRGPSRAADEVVERADACVNAGSKPELLAHPGGVDARGRRSGSAAAPARSRPAGPAARRPPTDGHQRRRAAAAIGSPGPADRLRQQ